MDSLELPLTFEEAVNEWKRFEEYLIQARYALRNPENGQPSESGWSQVIARVSNEFSDPKIRKALLEGWIVTATPFLMNGGNPYTGRKGFYSCYPLGTVEDSTEAIFEMERDLVTIFQHSGGGGIDVSALRSKDSLVDNGQGMASGPVSFAKGFSHLSARISQGGKRRGALMVQADWDIKDIREFVSFKGDNPGRYAGCNVSVNVTDDRFWKDEELLQWIAEYIWKSGDPGLLFTRKSLSNTPVPAALNPVFSNPCGEYLSTKDTACNLLTVNLARCLTERVNDFFNNVYESARLACLAGNEILDMDGFPPIPRIRENTLRFRPVGVGFTGLHHALNHWNISYGDEHDAPVFAKSTQLALMLGTMQGSIEYGEARKRRRSGKLQPQQWVSDYVEKIENDAQSVIQSSMGPLDNPLCEVTGKERNVWHKRLETIFSKLRKLGGLYNSVTTSQAPTGSISQLLGVVCTGIEPYYAMVQRRRVRHSSDSWREFTLVPLEFYSYSPDKLQWVEGQTAHNIDPYQQIRMIEACQDFNHTAVSKTINLPASTTVQDILEILHYVKKSRLKGITMFRDSSIAGILTDPIAGGDPSCCFIDLDERHGSTFKFRGPAPLYITANKGLEGHVREVFLNTTKSGSTLHGMSEALGRVISVSLQHDYRLIGKLAKTLEDISSEGAWFNKKLGRVLSIPAALAKVLGYSGKDEMTDDPEPYSGPSPYSACPSCGKLTLRRSGGCNFCVGCGFNSC
ncbi:hypothetical protein ACFL6N_03105 [Thermodesulfobacteriota bacterium]